MGSNCCRHKDQSPKMSLRKIFSRWSHRISPKSDTVKIADAEVDGNLFKRKDSIVVTDPEFETPESEDRNHVTMLHPDAPRAPTRKKTGQHGKRVSFQSDVEIMRTASSKSLDRFTVTIVQEEPKPRSKSFDSYFDETTLAPPHESLKQRRTSSLEHLVVEELPGTTCITEKLRRDTLGDALDLQAYKRPLVLPTPEEPVIEEEPDDSSEDEQIISSFKLASKLRRDTLGDALLLASKSRYTDETPTGSSTEDLEETLKHSRLCSKLRRDTFGDALKQAVRCKACSSMEDITELEVPLPATPEDEEDEEQELAMSEKSHLNTTDKNYTNSITSETTVLLNDTNSTTVTKSTWFKSETRCKTCMSLEVNKDDQCIICSSNENIPDLPNGIDEIHINPEKIVPEIKLFESESKINIQTENLSPTAPVKQLLLTDAEISQTLEKIRTTGKVEPKEDYNLVYSSSMKGPFASSKENLSKDDSGKTSSTDSLEVNIISKADILNPPDKSRIIS